MNPRRMSFAQVFLATLCVLALTQSVALASDPVQVANTMYKVIFENDHIRILDVNMAPGARAAMHSHPDLAVVVLAPSTIKWTRPGGKSEQSGPEFKRGAVNFNKADAHTSENIGKTPAHVILVEFKHPAPAAGRGRNPMLPAPYKQVADNPHARVFEVTLAPGGKVPEHTHGDHVAVSLMDATVEATNKAGEKQTINFKKDTAVFAGPVTHTGVNTGKTPAHLIILEMK